MSTATTVYAGVAGKTNYEDREVLQQNIKANQNNHKT